MWALPDRGEIWVKPSALNDVLCWSERYRGWTRIDLGTPVTAVCEADGTVYIALGAKIYKLTDSAAAPEIKPDMEIELAPVFGRDRAEIELLFHCRHKELVVGILIDDAHLFVPGAASAQIGRWQFPATGEKTTKYQIYVADELRPVLKSSGGTVVLDKFLMTEAEVV